MNPKITDRYPCYQTLAAAVRFFETKADWNRRLSNAHSKTTLLSATDTALTVNHERNMRGILMPA